MRMEIIKDEITPTLKALYANSSPENRKAVLSKIANNLKNNIRNKIENELQYDGKPMKSPAKETKYGGRFAKSYNWRYREGFRHLDTSEKKQLRTTGRVGGGRQLKETKRGIKVRRRIPVTAQSKQLQDRGHTIKSIDILSVNCNRAAVGPKTGHGRMVLGFHDKTRKPLGISKKFAEKARKYAFKELLKGVA